MSSPRTTPAPGRVLAAAVAALTLSLGVHGPARAETVMRFDVARAQALRDLAGNVIHVRGLRDLGRQAASAPVRVSLLMRVQHEDQLRQLVALQASPRSAYYKHFLTSAQFENYFAPSTATYARTIRMMQQRGFRITQTFANRGMIRAVMPSGVAERYFRTEIHRVFQPGAGYRYINVKPIVVPAEISQVAASVVGLHSASSIHMFHTAPRGRSQMSPLQLWAYETSLLASHAHRPLMPAQLARLQALRTQAAPALRGAETASVAHTNGIGTVAAPNASQLVHPAFIGETPNPYKTAAPISTSTPAANPNPDPTISPDNGIADYATYQALGPGVFAGGYDFPVMHGYGGSGAGVATLLDGDYLDSDATSEITTFGVPRGTKADVPNQLGMRVYTDGTKYTTTDSAGAEETTLDAETIMSLAPAANYYLYLEPSFDDEGLTASYEKIVSDNLVGVVSSSFGSCETDDPAFGYQTDYIALEGSAEGITFMASTGDTGGNTCGVYVTNGAPQTEKGVAIPSADIYFTAVGGTDYIYTVADGATYPTAGENGWTFGGGGVSVINPLPAWQASTSGVTTTGRNTPDVAFVADNMAPSAPIIVFETGTEEAVGGTSLSSPLFAAMQTEINQVEGTRNGWIDPRLYAIQSAQGYYAFHDVATGTNEDYVAGTGYDNVTGIGSVDGWFLAGEE